MEKLHVNYFKGHHSIEEHVLNFEFLSCLDDSNSRHFAARLQTKCQGVYGCNL